MLRAFATLSRFAPAVKQKASEGDETWAASESGAISAWQPSKPKARAQPKPAAKGARLRSAATNVAAVLALLLALLVRGVCMLGSLAFCHIAHSLWHRQNGMEDIAQLPPAATHPH